MVLGEAFLYGILGKITDDLASLAVEEIYLAWGVQEELRRLKVTSSAIEAVLLDAERRQAQSHAERYWLKNLQDVVHDISNVMDDIATEALRRRVENQFTDNSTHFLSRLTGKVTHLLSQFRFHFEMGKKIQAVRQQLDHISSDAEQFHFRKLETNMPVMVGRETYSYVRQSEIIGRDNDKEIIALKLLGGLRSRELTVVPIIGIGGLGKTTLAKLVYNDERVEAQFEPKKWVHVSTNFNLKKIIEDILGRQNSNLPLETLQTDLREKLNRKRFLLVFDDVWITNPDQWTELRDLLMVGAWGSTILITSRNEIVARIVGSVPYRLQGLSEDDSWYLLAKCAFERGKDKYYPKLVEIGRKIAGKCKGVPLAIKTLGSLLFSKTEEKEWFSVLNNDIWRLDQSEHGIMPVLRLSFDCLPSSMKQCFAYCAIYENSKSSIIVKEKLIQLWMAQGFIQLSDNGQQFEDIGSQCFDELLARSFFEDVNESDRDQATGCTMHDLMLDLARSIIGDELAAVNTNTQDISESVRHVFFSDDLPNGRSEFPESLLRLEKLRTFIWICGNCDTDAPIPIDPIISRFVYLRVLDLFYTDFEELPSSIEKLKHLRYLDLSFNPSMTRLPNSICKLYNLQTLRLEEGQKLEELPNDMWKLLSLRHLYVTFHKQRFFPDNGIGSLTSLRTLSIKGCNLLAFLPNSMQQLTALEDLNIQKCSELGFSENDMQGLTNLRRLTIVEVPKLVSIPVGLKQAATTLKSLYFGHCLGLSTLPDWLGNFASLQRLSICDCPDLMSLPEGMRRLTNLKQLRIEECPALMKRCERGRGQDWPKIAHVPDIYLSPTMSSDD